MTTKEIKNLFETMTEETRDEMLSLLVDHAIEEYAKRYLHDGEIEYTDEDLSDITYDVASTLYGYAVRNYIEDAVDNHFEES